MDRFLDLCVSSLRRGHANLLCIVPNFVNVFGFPLGREGANSLLYVLHRVRKLAVWGPHLADIDRRARATRHNFLNNCGIQGGTVEAGLRPPCASGTWRGTCLAQRCHSGLRLLPAHHAGGSHQSMSIVLAMHTFLSKDDAFHHGVAALDRQVYRMRSLRSLPDSHLSTLIFDISY